jgi:SAM-dependent methyltransferase
MTSPQRASDSDYARNRAEYDRFWSARWRRTHTYSAQTKLKRFRALLGRHGLRDRRLRVFDQGFGLGLMLFAFPPVTAIAGLEISGSAVAAAAGEAKKRGYRDVDLRVFTPGAPYPREWQGSFDLVISSHVLEHIADPRPVLAELLALLKPGGLACIVVPINELPGEDLNHFHQFTEASFQELLTGSGLTPLEINSCDRLLNLIKPVSRRLQRGPSKLDRILSMSFNLVFGFMPCAGLVLADRILSGTRWQPCQCFALCQKLQ